MMHIISITSLMMYNYLKKRGVARQQNRAVVLINLSINFKFKNNVD